MGKPGEIYVKSSNMMHGYYNNPEATRNTIDEDGWLHTGDMGSYDKNGEICICGRLKEIMKFRDYHIAPAEIENILLSHPGVAQVAVVPVPHKIDNERPMAFVVKVPGSQVIYLLCLEIGEKLCHFNFFILIQVTAEELITLSATLDKHKMLSGGVKFINQMPLNHSCKLKRGELVELAKSYAVRL